MKKFLSLVLALVMTMSLVTISAGAKNFTDDSKITYKDAVAVMSDIGVIDGYTGGGFQPTTTLTRGAAAKIICNMILGPTTAGALSADAAPFKDVPANHTFAGYIAYCAQQGIINGYADGTFRPAGTLNGYAFMKMLLGALGYDSKLEGYTGANWSIAVAKQALAIGLADGNDEFSGANAVTREEAMQYAFNTLDTDMVQYKDKGSSIIVGGVEIVNPASTNEKVPQDGYKKNMSNDETLQFAEKYFKDLKKVSSMDNFGRPAAKWSFKGDVSATVADEADATYTKGVKEKDLYKDLDVDSDYDKFDVYVDGVKDDAKLTLSSSSSTKQGGNGILTEVYYNDAEDEQIARIVKVTSYIAEIDDVDENDDDERIVKINGMEFVTEEFEEDDMVIYTVNKGTSDKAEQIQTMVAVEKMTGTLTKKSGADYTIDGKVYSGAFYDEEIDADGVKVKDDVDFYLDQYGYILKLDVAEESATVDNMAFVIKADSDRSEYAKLLFADGKTKTVDTEKDYNSLENQIVTFKNNDGVYKLTAKSGEISAAGKLGFEKGKTRFTGVGAGISTDSKTVFLYITDDAGDKDYNAYVGYKAAPSITADDDAKIVAYTSANKVAASLVVVDFNKADLKGSNADLTFVAVKDDMDTVDEGDGVVYYEFNAVVNGKITTVRIDPTEGAKLTKASGVYALNNVSYDGDDIGTPGTAPELNKDYYKAETAKKVRNETMVFGEVSYAYTDNVKVFYVDGKNIEEYDVSDIREDDNSGKNPYKSIFFTLDDGEIDMVILVKK